MSVFYDLNKTPRNILNQAIVRAIISENNGAWFDPSDMSTLYQDAAGTIPVTAVEQPVGKIIDKSGNGYHATQSITASRPTLSARKNILLATEALATQSVTTLAAQYTLSFTGTGSVTLSGAATGTLRGTGTDRASLTFTPTAGTLRLTVSGSVTKAQVELGSIAGPYQRVTTATDYDTDERYFPKYLRFDGVDDYMVYDSPYASSNNPSTHIIGVASRSLSTNLGFLTINPTSTTRGTQRSISISSASTVKADCRNSPVAISGTVDIATIHVFSASFGGTKRAAISVDGGAYTTAAISDTPNTTSTDTAIGKGLTNVSTAFNFYGSISVGADLTERQRHLCESYLGRKAGVQL